MRKFLIVGLYEDDTRWADTFEADTPGNAEYTAERCNPGVTIAGVIELVDDEMVVVG